MSTRNRNIIIAVIVFLAVVTVLFLLWWFLIRDNQSSSKNTCYANGYRKYDCLTSCDSSSSSCSSDCSCCSSCDSSSSSSSSDCAVACNTSVDYTNTQNVTGLNTTFATKHAVSSFGGIVVDQQAAAVTSRLHLYTPLGDSFYEKLIVDVPGINAMVSASSKYLFCATQAADLSDAGMAFVFAKSDTSWVEVQRLTLASKPLSIDSHDDYMLLRFAAMVNLYKDGVQDFNFKDVTPLDAKIYCDKILISVTGAAYLFKKKCVGVWEPYKTFLGNDSTFGESVDLHKKFLCVKDSTSLFIYRMRNLDHPMHKITVPTTTTYYHITGYENLVIWEKESVILYDYECGKWINTKTISLAGSLVSYVSHGDGWIFISKEIGTAANVALNIWKRTKRT